MKMLRDIADPAGRTASDTQTPFDVAVVIPTVLRPSLVRAVKSVFAQDIIGRVQILIGVDVPQGDAAMLDELARACPPNMIVTYLELPYSTSVRHGGLYPNRFSGALRTILSFAANSRYVAYLDDDNWWASDHLSDLKGAIAGADWAFSLRFFVEPETGEPICVDDWESVGPGAGVFAERFGGFVDPSSLMLDKLKCRDVLPLWSLSPFEDGTGEDRLVFSALADRFPHGATGRATSFYSINERDPNHPVRLQMMRDRGVVLPADRRAGIRTLADAVSGLPRSAREPAPAAPADKLMEGVLAHLKPGEVVVFEPNGDRALTFAAHARSNGVSSVVVVCAPWTEAEYRSVRTRLGQAAVALPPSLGNGPAWLARQRVACDLVYITETADRAAVEAAWPLIRHGGLLVAGGEVVPWLESYASENSAQLLPASIDTGKYWVLQKP